MIQLIPVKWKVFLNNITVLSLVAVLVLGAAAPVLGEETDPLDLWDQTQANEDYYRDIAYGNRTFVAVGNFGYVKSLTLGGEWQQSRPSSKYYFTAVSYCNDRFVAVGSGGLVVSSTDGKAWTRLHNSNNNHNELTGVAYGNGTYVAVGKQMKYVKGLTVWYSQDEGLNWTCRNISLTEGFDLYGVAFGKGKFAAVGSNGAIFTSEDGIDWTKCDSIGSGITLNGISYINGSFIALGTGGTILTSSDGITWGIKNLDTSIELYDMKYGNGSYVAVGMEEVSGSYNGVILTSQDMKVWERCSAGPAGGLYGLAYGNYTFCAVGTHIILTSDYMGPTVTGISPDIGLISGGTTVSITGTKMSVVESVYFGDTAAPSFSKIDDTSMTAVSPAGTGTVDVVLHGPEGISPISHDDEFVYYGVPAVEAIFPEGGPEAGGEDVYIYGEYLKDVSAVYFGETEVTDITCIGKEPYLCVKAPAGAGTVHVTVRGLLGISAISDNDLYKYVEPPVVSSITPLTGPETGGTTVTINGVGLSEVSAVYFGEEKASGFTVIDDTSLNTISPGGNGTVDVTVVGPGGTSSISSSGQFTYFASPDVKKISPEEQTITSGDTASFTVEALGAGSLSYQWKKDGSNIWDGGSISGASTATLTIANVKLSDEGQYSCYVSNESGGSDSEKATLTVKPKDAEISPKKVFFDLDDPADVITTVTWNDAQSVTEVVYGSEAVLLPVEYYTIGAEDNGISSLTISEDFLSGLNPSEGDIIDFGISFDLGKSSQLMVGFVNSYIPNTAPCRRPGIPASAEDNIEVDTAFMLELSDIFEDLDGDELTYKVSIDDEAAVQADEDYSYTPAAAGTTRLEFTTNDGMEESSDTYTVTLTVTNKEAATYTLIIKAGGGGSITKGSSGNYAADTIIAITATPAAGYSFSKWTSDDAVYFADANSSSTTFIMPAGDVTVTANFTHIAPEPDDESDDDDGDSKGHGSRNGDTGGSDTPGAASPTYIVSVSGNVPAAGTKLPVNLNANAGSAAVDIGALAGNAFSEEGTTIINMPSIAGVNEYILEIPAASLSGSQGERTLTFSTGIGSITIPENMLSENPEIKGTKAGITISQGDKSKLPEDIRKSMGSRPLVQLTLTMDGIPTGWNNQNAPVTVSIPYEPATDELNDPENTVVWYIDSSGNTVCIPNGHYDPATHTVTFTTTHFSLYAVGFNRPSFKDVPADAWYRKAVAFLSARGITEGTGDGNYSPEAELTRGQFMVMTMKAYGIEPDKGTGETFSDAGNTYYTGYLAAVKRLGIADGVGNNMFAPDKEITRQEMLTILYNTLKAIDKLPEDGSGNTLSAFSDAGQTASWAKAAVKLFADTGAISGNAGRLAPQSMITRAEMAQVLYNLLAK